MGWSDGAKASATAAECPEPYDTAVGEGVDTLCRWRSEREAKVKHVVERRRSSLFAI